MMRTSGKWFVVISAWLVLAAAGVGAQPAGRTARIGLLSSGAEATEGRFSQALREGLRELGWDEGRNLVIERRYAAGHFEQLPPLASELMALKVEVLVVAGAPAVQAARKVAGATPIVMTNTADPVGIGLVASLARPGGNITGLSDLGTATVSKRLQLLREAVPAASRIAVLMNPSNPSNAAQVKLTETTAAEIGVTLLTFPVRRAEELDRAFADMKAQQAGALMMIGDPFLRASMKRLAELSRQHRIPSMYVTREYPEAGGLLSYGTDFADLYRRAATYVDRILRGASAADLPIEQPTTLELVVNLRAARAIGITLPPSILARADRVLD